VSDLKVYKYRRQTGFSVVCDDMRDDLDLSDGAFRILVWMLNRPDSWQLNTLSISRLRKISKGKVSSISKELQSAGYLMIEKHSNGKTIWHVSEVRGTFADDQKTTVAKGLTVTTKVEPDPKNQDQVINQQLKPHPKNQDQVKNQQLSDIGASQKPEPDPKNPDQAFWDALVNTEYVINTENSNRVESTAKKTQSRRSAITSDWQPNQDVVEVIKKYSPCSDEFLKEARDEFVIYWTERGQARDDWNSTFRKRVKQLVVDSLGRGIDPEQYKQASIKPNTVPVAEIVDAWNKVFPYKQESTNLIASCLDQGSGKRIINAWNSLPEKLREVDFFSAIFQEIKNDEFYGSERFSLTLMTAMSENAFHKTKEKIVKPKRQSAA
jgi:hypothetical protein